MTWHADSAALVAYSAGRLHNSAAASVEAHLMTCGECRRALGERADQQRLATGWASIARSVDEPRRSVFERAMTRLGISETTSRLIALSPSVRLPWISAVVIVLAGTVVASHSNLADKAVYAFLVAAPLLPLVGIALSFGRADPVRELTMAAPTSKLELLLARAATVLLVTTVICALATVAFGREDWALVTWLFPALGLTAGVLALSTWIPTEWAAGGLSALWVTGAIVSVRGASLHAGLVERFVAFQPQGQVACLALTVIGLAVVQIRRDALEIGSLA